MLSEDQDALGCLLGQKRPDSEEVLSRLLSGDAKGAHEEAQRRDWPLSLLEAIEQELKAALENDAPMPEGADPEEFLEYARGTNESAQAGFVAIATVEMVFHRVGTLSQCKVLAQWLVDQLQGHPVEPVALSIDGLLGHAHVNPSAQYLVRWRGSVWVVSALTLSFSDQWVYGPQPGQKVPLHALDQAWHLAPM